MNKHLLALSVLIIILTTSCNRIVEYVEPSNVQNPDWVSSAVIYEVNTRQYTKEGTFKAFYAHLPRLQELGVKILWIMPIYPIGEKERKGSLGSYYSIKDYKSINPEFGTIDDFKKVVERAHELGMKIIIDWVANHTSRDAMWITSNPDWYVIDTLSNTPVAPFDWSDVAKLDFNNNDMRASMIDAMKYWVEFAGVDGFRCDVAAEVPVDFWDDAVKELKKINPELFMLAEAEEPLLQADAFNTYYGWNFHHIMNGIASGKYNAETIRAYYAKDVKRFPVNTIPMLFTSNHDENSWNGTEFERLNQYAKQMAALTFVLPGMPLIYNGQEVGFNRRLNFFEKDSIEWKENIEFTELYKGLIKLRINNPALSSIKFNGFREIHIPGKQNIFAFARESGGNSVVSIFNFTSEQEEIQLTEIISNGEYMEFPIDLKVKASDKILIDPYGYKIYSK